VGAIGFEYGHGLCAGSDRTKSTAPGTDKQPELVASISPEYSDEARKLKLRVVAGLTVDKKGRPKEVHVLRGPGHGLDEKAVKAVKHYRLTPTMKDGDPVPAEIMIYIAFRICFAGDAHDKGDQTKAQQQSDMAHRHLSEAHSNPQTQNRGHLQLRSGGGTF
jgi:TonB family protein